MTALLDHALDLASHQHGLVRVDQLVAAGASSRDIAALTRSNRMERVAPRVLRAPGSHASPRQEALLAVADAGPGAALSLEAGAALWEAPGYRLTPPQVLAHRLGNRRQHRDHIIHLARRLLPHHVTVLDGIPVVTPSRLPFDLAAHLHPGRLERLIDHLWARRLTSGALLRQHFDEIAGRGWHGTRVLRAILADRGDDYRPPESNLEARALQILVEAGLDGFERQVDIGGERWIGRVDLADLRRKILLEVDGDRFHTALVDQQADASRQAALEAAGWIVVRVTEWQVWHDRGAVVEAVLAARRLARSRGHR